MQWHKTSLFQILIPKENRFRAREAKVLTGINKTEGIMGVIDELAVSVDIVTADALGPNGSRLYDNYAPQDNPALTLTEDVQLPGTRRCREIQGTVGGTPMIERTYEVHEKQVVRVKLFGNNQSPRVQSVFDSLTWNTAPAP